MPANNVAESVKDFLVNLDESELDEIREYLGRLVDGLQQRQAMGKGKRPHMAMPERRLGDRYNITLVGHAGNALARGKGDKSPKPIRIMDLSRDGCGIISNALFYPGQILSVTFKAPSGHTRTLYVEVARSRECSLPRQTIYQMGCRLVTRDVVNHVREELHRREGLQELFSDPSEIRIVQLATGKGARNVSGHVAKLGYSVVRITTATRIPAALEEHDAQVLIVPVAALKGRRPAWLTRLRHERAQTAVIALASEARESIRLIEMGVEQVVDVSDYASELDHAIKCALFIKLPWLERHVSKYPVKALLAGPDERQLRRSETLMLQENCLVAKAKTPQRMLRELRMQQFHVVVVSERFFDARPDLVSETHAEHPALVIVVETPNAKKSTAALEQGADLVVSPTANRAQLTQIVDHAYYLALTRSYLL